MGIIWHYMRPGHIYPVGWADLFVVIAAILVLIRPQNSYFLLATAATGMLAYLLTLPSPSNHWTLQFLFHAAISVSFAVSAYRRKSLAIDSRDWFDSFRPALCLLILMLYLFASLHKLNSGYFSEGGFAIRLYRDIVFGKHMTAFAHLFPTPEAFMAILPHLSILTELAIPLLLFFRRSRLIAILLGISFHGLLSLKEYPPGTDFPTLLGAAYILFLPPSSIDIIRASVLDRMRGSGFYQHFKSLGAPAILLAAIFVPLLYSLPRHSSVDWFTFANLKSAHWAAYLAIYFAVAVFLLFRLRSADYDNSPPIIRGLHSSHIALLILAFFIGMSPYLGLRTAGAFAMFSNLETEGNYSNHFFMPPGLQIFDYQKQVCVIETSADDIPTTALTGELLTYYNFRKLTRRNPEASIVYTFEGERVELERIADKPELVAGPDVLERYYVVLNLYEPERETYCGLALVADLRQRDGRFAPICLASAGDRRHADSALRRQLRHLSIDLRDLARAGLAEAH